VSAPTVLVTRDAPLLAQAAALRAAVFTGEQGVDPAIEVDGHDACAAHVVAIEGADSGGSPPHLLATARLLEVGERAVVGRVAVRCGLRRRGIGAAMMRELEREAVERGLLVVELHAQVDVEGFYRRLGYQTVGEHYLEAGIEHVTMTRELVSGVRAVRDDDAEALQQLIRTTWSEYPGCVLDVDAEEPWLRAPARAYDAAGKRFWVVEGDRAVRGGDRTAGDGAAGDGAAGDGAAGDGAAGDGAATVLACVGLRPDEDAEDAFELKSLYVAAEARRSGLGRALTRLVERQAREDGRPKGRLWTDTRFHDAHRLYERLGWTRTGAQRDLHDLSNTTEYEMVRELPKR